METVQMVVEVPDERAAFMLELLENIRFVSNPRILREDEDASNTDEAEDAESAASSAAED